MKISIPQVVLGFVFWGIVSGQMWPEKGDIVYISASFKKLSAPSPVAGAQMNYDMPPCAKLEIIKANQKKQVWIAKDPVGGSEKLEGDWLPRMHKTKEVCEAFLSTAGEPTVMRSGETFKIVPKETN